METFKQHLLKTLEELCLDTDIEIITSKIVKQNDTSLTAICLKPTDSTIGTNYYVEELFKRYESGSTIPEIAKDILLHHKNSSFLANNLLIKPFITQLSSYECIKNNLTVRLLNLKANRNYLSDKVFKPYLKMNASHEFAISLCISIPDSNDDEHGIITVNQQLRNMWDVTDEELFEIALLNTEKKYSCTIRSMFDVLTNLGDDSINNLPNLPSMYVMTNNVSLHGSATLLYTNSLKSFADELDSDFYIIPSSVHEVILIPTDETIDVSEIQDTITEVNRTAIAHSEFLSNQLLYYSHSDDCISICKPYTRD